MWPVVDLEMSDGFERRVVSLIFNGGGSSTLGRLA